MKRLPKLSAAACLLLGAMPASAATLIPVSQIPGSLSTNALAINDSNMIAGGYYDSNGVEHGFFGTLDGNYTTFDYTQNPANGTEARGISNDGFITGDGWSNDLFAGYEFVRKPDGTMQTVAKSGANLDGIAGQIITGGTFVGDYWDHNTGAKYAYEGKKGKWRQDITVPFETTVAGARGLNKSGTITGNFKDPNTGYYHGFVIQNGIASQIDYPDKTAVQTLPTGINEKNVIVGDWQDGNGASYGFTLDIAAGTFKLLKIPNATFVQAWASTTPGWSRF